MKIIYTKNILLVCSLLSYPMIVQGTDYTEMSLEELLEVEITLDDAFDIFDALIERRQVSVATGKKQDASRAPAVTTVITAMDIEAMGATDLDEVLETVPGLHVHRAGNRYAPIYTVRGIASSQGVLLLINGNPIKELWSGDATTVWAGMPIKNIARIEVVRGPGSAVFGADAFTGVINIITKSTKDIKTPEIGTRIGSFKTKEVWGLYGGTYDQLDVAFAAEYRETDGHREIIEKDAQTALDQKYNTHVSLAPGPVNLSKRNLNLNTDLSYGKWQLRGGYEGSYDVAPGLGVSNNTLDKHGRNNDERTHFDLNYQPTLTNDWEVKANLNYLNTKWYNDIYQYPPGSVGMGGFYPDGQRAQISVAERHTRFSLSGLYSGFKHHLVRTEVGYYYGELHEVKTKRNYDPITVKPLPTLSDFTDTSYAAVPENSRKNSFASIQDIWMPNHQWEFTVGIRYDRYSDFGNTINPRLALVWHPHSDLTTKLLYGRAFLTPTATQLYLSIPGRTMGNPNLESETINMVELAFDYRPLTNLNLACNLFRYKISDKISAIVVGGMVTHQNMVTWEGHGLELEARWKATPRLSLMGHYSFQHSIDEKDNDLKDAPQHQGFLRADWMMIPDWYLDARIKWIADRERALNDRRPAVEDYALTDLTFRYKDIRQGHWNIALAVRNVFDEDAREPALPTVPYDLPLAGRSYFLEWNYRF